MSSLKSLRPCLHTRLSVPRALSAAPASWKARHTMSANSSCGTSSSVATFTIRPLMRAEACVQSGPCFAARQRIVGGRGARDPKGVGAAAAHSLHRCSVTQASITACICEGTHPLGSLSLRCYLSRTPEEAKVSFSKQRSSARKRRGISALLIDGIPRFLATVCCITGAVT